MKIIIFEVFSASILILCWINNVVAVDKSEPEKKPKLAMPCFDNRDYRFEHISDQTCSWIKSVESRRQIFCQHYDVVSNCPITCGHCCKDDTSYTFRTNKINGTSKTCDWIAQDIIKQRKYCHLWKSSLIIREACPLSCNLCKPKVIDTAKNKQVRINVLLFKNYSFISSSYFS